MICGVAIGRLKNSEWIYPDGLQKRLVLSMPYGNVIVDISIIRM